MSKPCGFLLFLGIIKKCTPLCRRLICAFDLTELSLLWDGRRFNLYCVRVAFAFLVFCESRCCYYSWIYYRSLFYDQSFCCELLYHLWKKLFLQLVFWDGSLFLQCLCLSFIVHHNILAVTAVSFFCILPEKIRSPAWTAVRRIFHHRNRSLLLSHKCSWR